MSLVEEVSNRACDLGPSKFPWWQDWRGQAAAIVASGPSTKKAGIELLRGRLRVIAIKENVDLCPWADVVYGCDAAWWKNKRGLTDYSGLKVAFDTALRGCFRDINLIDVRGKVDRILLDEPGVVGGGGNSGFQAVNLAAQFGASRILLVGFDLHDRSGLHWYGRNVGQGRNNPNEDNFRRWRLAFEASADDFVKAGMDVVNASPISALKCFRRRGVAETLAEWGL